MTDVITTRRRARREDWVGGYLMVAPTLIGLCLFVLWPVAQSFFLSFTSWGDFGKWEWTGLENLTRLVGDAEVHRAFLNTFILAVVSVPLTIAIAIVLAVLLNQRIRAVGAYRVLYFLPVVTMPAATAMIWQWMFNGDFGLINSALATVGFDGPNWLTDPNTAMIAMIVVIVWTEIGMNVVLLLAGMQGISSTFYEAASIDGAGPTASFFRITLPLLTPTIFLATIIGTIGNLQIFDIIYLMIGPANPAIESVQTATYLFYELGFIQGDRGYAATIVLVLFVVIALITALQFRLQRKWVHYE